MYVERWARLHRRFLSRQLYAIFVAKVASSFKHVRNPCDIAATNRTENRTWFTRAILKLQQCLWQIFFYFLVRFYFRFWCEKRKKFPSSDFPSPRFSRLKTWNFTSGWVKNRVKRETGDSCVVTCHREHIDNQREREVRDCGDDTRQQPRNPSLFLRQSSLSVKNKMSSFQAAVEFDSNQESSDSDLSETILVSNREIPVYVLFSFSPRRRFVFQTEISGKYIMYLF